MKVGFDLDGTIDSAPASFCSLMTALRQAGHMVFVLTGAEAPKVTADEVQKKREYLQELGCGQAYDQLVLFGDPPHKAKAKFCRKKGISLLFDNNLLNAKFASRHTTVLVPWNTRDPRVKEK